MLRLDPGSAVETYRRALTVDNSLSNVWFNLANAYLKLGEEEEAARWLVVSKHFVPTLLSRIRVGSTTSGFLRA